MDTNAINSSRRGIAAGIKLTMDFRPAFELKGARDASSSSVAFEKVEKVDLILVTIECYESMSNHLKSRM